MRHARGLARGLGAVVASAVLSWAGPAEAGISIECSGFTDCLTIGQSDAGYGRVHQQSFWHMTPGHNCTNYVAYRLTHGRLVARPPGTDSAYTWGPAAAAAGIPVDQTPRVGAVAWWGAGVGGASASGHVAYVEAVLPGGAVRVSEDNLTGDFRWRVMHPGDAVWPSGFIHYPASDGSPTGELTSVTSPAVGTLDLWASAMDPDASDDDRTYLVSLGGPRGTAGAETFMFRSEWFRFHRIAKVGTRGPTTLYLYALNAPGTAGRDTFLGRRSVTVQAASTTKASFVDASIKRSQHPRLRVSLAPSRASGTVEIVRGSTVVKRVSLRSGTTRTVTLPRQRAGKWTIAVTYRRTAAFAASGRSVRLRVR